MQQKDCEWLLYPLGCVVYHYQTLHSHSSLVLFSSLHDV